MSEYEQNTFTNKNEKTKRGRKSHMVRDFYEKFAVNQLRCKLCEKPAAEIKV